MAKATAKYIRMSPRKARRAINVIRGKDIAQAQTILKFMPYAASRVIEKVLKSAVANAKENENLNPEELKISKAFVDGSTTLRRWRAMSRGRGYPILKRMCHITIEVIPTNGAKPSKSKAHEKVSKVKHEHKHEEKEEKSKVKDTTKEKAKKTEHKSTTQQKKKKEDKE